MDIVVLAEPSTLPAQAVSALEGLGTARYVDRTAQTELALQVGSADLLVFDPTLVDPGFVRRMQRQRPYLCVVAVLRHSSSAQAADLLEDGAAEALDGTMGERELRARLERAIAPDTSHQTEVVDVDGLSIDPAHGETRWRGVEIALTRRERDVLHVLAAARGQAVRREVIYRDVWGFTMARGDRSVDVNVNRLRGKLGEAAGGDLEIKTLPGVGYRLEAVAAVEPVTAS